MQRSIVNYKTVKENSDFRIDADYYKLIRKRKVPGAEHLIITKVIRAIFNLND
ncbi:MAG: hypothetical protein K9L61_04165 [Candidatus Omnitrophica bacterium]|nr:hypothetical protein [Candidatus Omnitrophota bacterium]